MPFFSIQLNSNRPAQITEFFDNIEATADTPEEIEVLLHIDTGDTAMEEVVAREKLTRRFTLRVLQTDLVKGYTSLWKPLNPLFAMTHPDVYFVANLFDEIRFETKGWDSKIRAYKGYYPDDIFRLRSSQFRFRNYIDFWQCGFAPDSSAFYTRRWLELGGDWNPCMGPDSFQQCVAFYMSSYDPFRPRPFSRDIAVTDIAFSGEGTNVGISNEAREKRQREDNRLWFILMSHRMQQEANRRAMRMNSQIISHMHGGDEENEIIHDEVKRTYAIRNKRSGGIVETVPYRLSWARITLTNIWRGIHLNYYCGRGSAARDDKKFLGIKMIINAYSPAGARWLARFERFSTGAPGRLARLKRAIYQSQTLRRYVWFLRAPYRRILKSLGR